MWREHALPRLQAGRLGVERASHTLRLTGVGESALVGLIGEEVLRAANPQVATYARADAVDLVVTAVPDGRLTAQQLVDDAVGRLRDQLSTYVFAEGDETWADALEARLGGKTIATVELGSGGQLVALLGTASYLAFAELLTAQHDITHATTDLGHYAQAVRDLGKADIGLALHVRQARDTHVRVAIATADGIEEFQRVAFLAGDEGRRRAAIAAAAALWQYLGRGVAAMLLRERPRWSSRSTSPSACRQLRRSPSSPRRRRGRGDRPGPSYLPRRDGDRLAC
jgi:hypothetical protein